MKREAIYIPAFMLLIALVACSPSPRKGIVYSNLIYYDEKAPFQDRSAIRTSILEECKIEENMVWAVLEQSKQNGMPLSKVEQERVLTVTINRADTDERGVENLGLPVAYLTATLQVKEGNETIFSKIGGAKQIRPDCLGWRLQIVKIWNDALGTQECGYWSGHFEGCIEMPNELSLGNMIKRLLAYWKVKLRN